MTGTAASTVPQCVLLKGTRELAVKGVRGRDFLSMRALTLKGVLLETVVTSRL